MSENLTTGANDSKVMLERILSELSLINARTRSLEFMIQVLASDVLQLRADQLIVHDTPDKVDLKSPN